MNRKERLAELHELRTRVAELEEKIYADDAPLLRGDAAHSRPELWKPEGFYLDYHLIAGFVLGSLGALASLVFNVVGAALVGMFPLELIRVYLTFPLGERALQLDSGMALGVGVCLYLATGAIYGMMMHYVLVRHYAQATLQRRFVVASVMALILWIANFYLILSWLQPHLFGGNWIVSMVPPYVAAATHLVFGWAVVLLGSLGQFENQWDKNRTHA